MSEGTVEAGGQVESGDGGGGGGEGAAAGAVGDDRFASAFEQFQQSIEGRFAAFEERLPAPADDDEDEEPEFDLPEYGDDDFDENGQVTQEAQLRALQQVVQAEVERARAPELARQAQERRNAYADHLEQTYPRLQDPKVQEEVIGKTIAFCESIGKPELAQEPRVLEQIFLAMYGQDAAKGGGQAGQEVHVEGATAATPRGGQETKDPGDAIVALAQRKFRVGSR